MNISEHSAISLIARIWKAARDGITADPMDAVTIGTEQIDRLEGVLDLLREAKQADRPTRAIAAATVAQARIQSFMAEADASIARHRTTHHRAENGAGVLR